MLRAFRCFRVHAFRARNHGCIRMKISCRNGCSKRDSSVQKAFLGVRSVGLGSLVGVGVILVFIFAGGAFAADDAGQMQARDGTDKDVVGRRLAASDDGSTPRMVLPLDHGPRATTTPWLNQQRRLKAMAAASAARAASTVDPGTATPTRH